MRRFGCHSLLLGHDLRDSNNVPLRNSLDRLPATASRAGNPAFWQHMSTFIVGYGVSGSMDNSGDPKGCGHRQYGYLARCGSRELPYHRHRPGVHGRRTGQSDQ